MEKTLGGDRLGSGKKMKVELHGYERSTHDLGYIWRSTMASGTLVPFLCEVALPGDTFDIHLDCDIKTHPTIGPLFGSYKVQLDVFQAPLRLYQAQLHNNALNIGRNMSLVKLPQIELRANGTDVVGGEFPADLDNCQINPSSIMAYLGIRGLGWINTAEQFKRQFNAIPLLAYWEIYKNYYSNKQEEIGAVLHTPVLTIVDTVDDIFVTPFGGAPGALPELPATGLVPVAAGTTLTIDYSVTTPRPSEIMVQTTNHGTVSLEQLGLVWGVVGTTLVADYNWAVYGTDVWTSWRMRNNTDIQNGIPTVVTFPLSNIDAMRRVLLAHDDTVAVITATSVEPYGFIAGISGADEVPNLLSSQEGLGLKTYQSDLFNNWLSTEWIDGPGGIAEITSVDTSGGSFTIDSIILARKVYNMLNRIAVSGGSYDDWLDAVYAHDRYQRCESPMYLGGLIKELVFQEITSNSEANTEGGAQPLGTLAGKGIMGKKHKGGTVIAKVDEPSYIIGIISLTPRIDNSQGNKWDTGLKTMDDLHKPALDEIGFQELITEQMAWWDTELTADETYTQKSAGKQPAWLNYMTNVNVVRGNFAIATNEMFMTLNRRYEIEPGFPILGIKDLTTYIDPSKFNNIFAQTALDSQNFWAQIALDITARRKMSAKLMPNL